MGNTSLSNLGHDVQDILTCANYLAIEVKMSLFCAKSCSTILSSQDVVDKCENFIIQNLESSNCLEVIYSRTLILVIFRTLIIVIVL